MKALVIGFGISGKSAAALLQKQGYTVVAVDKNPNLKAEGIEIFPDSEDFPLDGYSLAILSPGIPLTHPLVRKALKAGIEVIGEIEFAFRFLKNRCIGITGSNGKTTTVTMIAHVLNACGKKARALGNVGASLTGYLLDPDAEEILVIELSSFQIETLETRCLEAAGILNITPNHLDRYASMEEYATAKLRLQDCLKDGGKFYVSKQVYEDYGGHLKNVALISEEGYNQRNAKAAFAFCSHFGVGAADFQKGLETYRKPSHRIEWVAEIDGASYYNDSKSSNIHSVMYAMEQFEGSVILLIGGVHKGSSYSPWIEAFGRKVKKIIAFGQAAGKMEEDLSSAFRFMRVETMQEAMKIARAEAVEKDVVLLSPGCSSYDQFRNFEHRGDEFKKLVRETL